MFCADLERMPDQKWECKECQNISRERLILMLKEKSRQKQLEREMKKNQEKEIKEQAKQRREVELRQRREEKEFRK